MQSSAISLKYLQNKPKRIFWEIVAPKGARLSPIQQYDLIYDEKDLKWQKGLNGPKYL